MRKTATVGLGAALIAAGLVLGVGLNTTAPAQEKAAPPPPFKWEYKVVSTLPTDKSLNEQGDDGWELVTMHWAQNTPVSLIFKRPKR